MGSVWTGRVRRVVGAIVAASLLSCSMRDPGPSPAESTGPTRTSTEAVTAASAPSPPVADFVLYAANSIDVEEGAAVRGGHVGVKDIGKGPFLVPGFELAVEKNAVVDANKSVFGDSVLLAKGSTVGAVFTNHLT